MISQWLLQAFVCKMGLVSFGPQEEPQSWKSGHLVLLVPAYQLLPETVASVLSQALGSPTGAGKAGL